MSNVQLSRNVRYFTLCKFRTMTNQRIKTGPYCPDEMLNEVGETLRLHPGRVSELFNISKGDVGVLESGSGRVGISAAVQ